MPKTEKEIQALKDNWIKDPCWDIETTPGFEDVAIYLRAYRSDCEREWERQWQDKLRIYADSIGLGNNLKLAEYIRDLEERVETMKQFIKNAGLTE